MSRAQNRIAVLHGVNFDVLERRDRAVYGGLSLNQLEMQIGSWAGELGLEALFSRPTQRVSSLSTCIGFRSWLTAP